MLAVTYIVLPNAGGHKMNLDNGEGWLIIDILKKEVNVSYKKVKPANGVILFF